MVKALIKPVSSLYHSMVIYVHTFAYDRYQHLIWWPSPEVIILVPCSTQLNMTFQVLIKKTKILQIKTLFAFKLSDVAFIMLINVKMPTIVGILTFMSRINSMFS